MSIWRFHFEHQPFFMSLCVMSREASINRRHEMHLRYVLTRSVADSSAGAKSTTLFLDNRPDGAVVKRHGMAHESMCGRSFVW